MWRRPVSIVSALAVVLAAGCTVNPVTGKSQLDLLGEAQEIEMGKSLYPQAIQGSLGPISDAEVQAEVERVGESVATVSHRPGLPYSFTAVNDPEVNAFALPGGKICITRGLVARLDSEDGLAAVLGHEVGHVTARHAVAAYNRQLIATAVLVGGAVYMEAEDVKNRELIGIGALLGTQLVLAHYSREQERQSDDLGIAYAVKAGYSPRGMIETQQVLLDLQKTKPGLVDRLFASHPMSADRLATAKASVAKLPADVQDRPLREQEYQRSARGVIAVRPAWDRAQEGQRLLADKKLKEGEDALADAVRQAPSEGVVRTLHATALAAVKREDAAITEAREGACLAPGVFLSSFVAGQLLLKPNPREALEHLDRAEELLRGVADVSLARGTALEGLGRRDDAAAAYRETVKRDPTGSAGSAANKRLQAMGIGPG